MRFVYSELNDLNRKLGLKLKHDKPPRRPDFIERLWTVRNHSIAHWAGTERRELPESVAGLRWGWAYGSKAGAKRGRWDWDLEELVPLFSNQRLRSIPQTDIRCTHYPHAFDRACANYLAGISRGGARWDADPESRR